MIHNFQKAEQIFVPIDAVEITAQSMEEYILSNFSIPDNNLGELCEFISRDSQIEKIFFSLPDLIKTEFPNDKLQIRFFFNEFNNQELMLEIGIFTSFDVNTSLQKEEKLERKLFELYQHSADKLLLIVELQYG